MRIRVLGFLIVGLLASPLLASALPIVVNGGFETGDLTGWTCIGADDCQANNSPDYVHSGSYAMRGYDNEGYATLAQTIATTTGSSYDFGFYSRTTYDFLDNVLRYQIGSGPVVTVPRTTAWLLTATSFVASGASTEISFYFQTYYGTGTWSIDDVAVKEVGTSVPDPGSSLLLLGMGLVGLRAWRNRA